MPSPTHGTPPAGHCQCPKRGQECDWDKEEQLCKAHQEICEACKRGKMAEVPCKWCTESEHLREMRAAKEAMDAKRANMSSYSIWMEAAKEKRKKSTTGTASS